MEEQEEWRDVEGYEGLYQVSNLGRVRSPRKVLSPSPSGRKGYLAVWLSKGGKVRPRTVHRLVALAFLPPRKHEKEEVNHLNAIRTDNRAANLEWTDRLGNMKHAIAHGLMRPNRRAVVGISLLDGSEVHYRCQRDAEYALSGTGKQSSAINHCLYGKKKSAYGYAWRRA